MKTFWKVFEQKYPMKFTKIFIESINPSFYYKHIFLKSDFNKLTLSL